jgi:hypothetical protein
MWALFLFWNFASASASGWVLLAGNALVIAGGVAAYLVLRELTSQSLSGSAGRCRRPRSTTTASESTYRPVNYAT